MQFQRWRRLVNLIILLLEGYCDQDTSPDEEFKNIFEISLRGNSKSMPFPKSSRPDNNKQLNFNKNEGPNINLKLPRRTYGSSKEKQYFYDKIKTKQKSEVTNYK